MARSLKLGVVAAITSLSLGGWGNASRGGLITDLSVEVTAKPGGLFEYDYTLTDEPASSLAASQLFLAVSPGADLSAVSAPGGWDVFYSPGDPDISFLSSGPSTDIVPGASGAFSFASATGPAAGDDLVRGFDFNSGTFGENPGTIPTPSAVPEPPSLALGALGAALAAAYLLVHRRPRALKASVS
jgi:hypothetical protein